MLCSVHMHVNATSGANWLLYPLGDGVTAPECKDERDPNNPLLRVDVLDAGLDFDNLRNLDLGQVLDFNYTLRAKSVHVWRRLVPTTW